MDEYGIAWSDGRAPSWKDEGTSSELRLAALVLVDSIAIAGNATVILAILNDKELRTKGANQFIVSLCCSDLAYAFVQGSFSLSTLVNERFPGGEAACETMGFLFHFFAPLSVMLLLVVTIDRYYLIVLNRPTPSSSAAKGIMSAVAIGIVFGAMPLFGFGRYNLQPSLTSCWGRGGSGPWHHNAYLVIASCFPVITAIGMGIGYYLMHKAISSTFAQTAGNKSLSLQRDAATKELAVLKLFCVITGVFFATWIPCITKFIFEISNHPIKNPAFDWAVSLTVGVGVVVNPIVYGHMNKRIGKSIRDLLPACAFLPASPPRSTTSMSASGELPNMYNPAKKRFSL